MNLRILKKLSKRAAPLLPLLGDKREQFDNEDGDGDIHFEGFDRKHWDRSPAIHDHKINKHDIVVKARRAGRKYPWVHYREPYDPWPFTPTIGAWDGGESPEWHDEVTWYALKEMVCDYYSEYWVQDIEVDRRIIRRLPNPSVIFRMVQVMIVEHAAEEARQHAAWLADIERRKKRA